jgi:predicted RND superfamily exporter protein
MTKGQKPTLLAAAITAIGMAVTLMWTRGAFDGLTAIESAGIVVAVIAGASVYWAIIHYILKGWDRLRDRLGGK